VPLRFAPDGCKPAKKERCDAFTNIHAPSTVRKRPRKSGATPNMAFLLRFFFVKSSSHVLSLQSRSHFADIISQKCTEHAARSNFLAKIEPWPKSCALLVHNFPRSRRAPAETETLLRRSQKPQNPKKTTAARREELGCRSCRRASWEAAQSRVREEVP
jgi:hypothetical protein